MKIIQPTTLTLILLFNIVSINFSQSNLLSIKGIVQDISGQPTVYATVSLTKKVSNFAKFCQIYQRLSNFVNFCHILPTGLYWVARVVAHPSLPHCVPKC